MPRARSKTSRRTVSAQNVIDHLGMEYGPIEWESSYDPAHELVSTILSQHTSDLNSERAFESLMKTFGSLEAVAEAPVRRIEKAIRMGGLAKTKAPRIKAILNYILAEVGSFDLSFLGDMPLSEAKAWLKDLPGIGPKSAAIILCFSLGRPAMPVDTHIYRVSRRLGLIGPKVTADQAHDILESMVVPDDVFPFHMYLINHGRRVCKAQRPRCDSCVLSWGCPSRRLFIQSPRRAPSQRAGRRSAPTG